MDRPDLDESKPLNDINFFDPDISDCSHHPYRTMRDDASVWFDLDLADAHKHLTFGFCALVERVDATDLSIESNYFLRALKSRHIGFRAV